MTLTTPSPDTQLSGLAQKIAGQWATASWPGLRRLKVEATADAIRVTGNVSTFFEKQQAWHWARRVAQGVWVEDEIDVVSRQNTRSSPMITAWTTHAIWSSFALLAMALSLLA